ncbi:uncharacterized protein LOC115217682 [Octopus sinensis]|uniref:Uncharacterized protein LOC115217682 n=1 Tax=Octopus sinensis TaxID=2607531 RepID=A0A6P7SY30_9MOLL|nr:uncharacterized protein LOC115217682 [Octopus sinensis]
MAQTGVDITNLPKTDDSYCCIVVAMDHFSKRPEARSLKYYTAESVGKFLFEDVICRHLREFVNIVSADLHKLTGTQQHITNAYYPQANGFVEQQNHTIKYTFIKSLEDRSNWVECLSAVLFAYRTVKHSSTHFTPFQILYNRQVTLSVELQHNPTAKDRDSFGCET